MVLSKKSLSFFIIFKFLVTNNDSEYEALVSVLRLAKKIQANKITIYIDSQFIA